MADPAPLIQSANSVFPDWANWGGFFATTLGLLVSIVGLIATYRQAKQAKQAALDTKEAAKEAISKLQDRNLLSNLSSMISQVGVIREHINQDNFQAARITFEICSRSIKDIFYNLNIPSKTNPQVPDGSIDIALKEISEMFDKSAKGVPESRKAYMLRSIRMISDTMVNEEAKRRWDVK